MSETPEDDEKPEIPEPMEEEEETQSTYQKFMTPHEMAPAEAQRKFAPAMPEFDERD